MAFIIFNGWEKESDCARYKTKSVVKAIYVQSLPDSGNKKR
jgi:hypothetical protein